MSESVESDYKVPLTHIREIKAHPNAERLEIAVVYGWEVVVGKGQYQVGDKVFYIPANSIISTWLESYLFPEGSKIKLDRQRVKAIKIRGTVSQGMLVNQKDVIEALVKAGHSMLSAFLYVCAAELEQDYQKLLGVSKYMAPVRGSALTPGKQGEPKNKQKDNPNFHKYGGLNNIKWCPDVFAEGEEVIVTEKIHGTNFRAGWVPFVPKTRWEKVKHKVLGWFGKERKWEFVWGSNNVQLQNKGEHKGFYDQDFYGTAVVDHKLKDRIPKGAVVYGEIFGPGVQKGYNYNLVDCLDLVFFDIKFGDNWGHFKVLEAWAKGFGMNTAPVLYEGPFNRDLVEKLVSGPSVLAPTQPVREGIVVKNVGKEYNQNRKALKWINPAYSMKEAEGETTDFQ